nr:unnamed protein product [Callosobruchus chinensis]
MASDVHVCGACSQNFIVSSKYVACKKCEKRFHNQCVSIKDDVQKLLGKTDNLMWCCDGCKKSVLEMLQGTRQEASNETIVYKKEIECLKREKSLLEKLLQEIEFSHELLKTQLKRNAEGHISSLDTQATSTKTAVHTLEYSTVAKKQPKKESAILLVNTSDHNDNTNVMDHIKRNINPAELNIRIDGTRKTKNGVAVYCDNASDVNKLENALKTKLGSTYQIHQPKKFNPRMIISNVTLGDELNNDEAITSDIIGLNDLKEIESSQIKIITKLKTRNNDHHIVIEVPPDVRNQFVRTGHVYLSWGRYVVADHLNVIQCRRCFSFGHYEKDCRSTSPVCGKCAGNHQNVTCRSFFLFLIRKHPIFCDLIVSQILINYFVLSVNCFFSLNTT